MSVTRYVFVSGLPGVPFETLCRTLDQNPKVMAATNSPAARVLRELDGQFRDPSSQFAVLDQASKDAMLRASLDAVHHARPLDTLLCDGNLDWLSMSDRLADLFPMSRFVLMVRDPEAIMDEMQIRPEDRQSALSEEGVIGASLMQVKGVLDSAYAARVLLIDYDRFQVEASGVLDAVYRFMQMPCFTHDTSAIEPAPEILPKRRVVSWRGAAQSARRLTQGRISQPIWRRRPASAATMVLSGT